MGIWGIHVWHKDRPTNRETGLRGSQDPGRPASRSWFFLSCGSHNPLMIESRPVCASTFVSQNSDRDSFCLPESLWSYRKISVCNVALWQQIKCSHSSSSSGGATLPHRVPAPTAATDPPIAAASVLHLPLRGNSVLHKVPGVSRSLFESVARHGATPCMGPQRFLNSELFLFIVFTVTVTWVSCFHLKIPTLTYNKQLLLSDFSRVSSLQPNGL